MSWVIIIWAMIVAASLTLAAQHLLIGIRQRALANLLFAVSGVSVAVIAVFEFLLMRADTSRQYGELVRGIHVPIFFLVGSLVFLVWSYFGAGRIWLGVAVLATRGAALVANFLHQPNLNFVEITGIRKIPFLGEKVSVADGIVSRWTRLGELSSLLLALFLVDAAVTVWRRGDRRRAAVVGGSMILFVVFAAGHTALVHAGILSMPYLISVPYVAIVLATSYELTFDVLRASSLTRDLQESRSALRESDLRLALAADAARLRFWSWDADADEIWTVPGEGLPRGDVMDERIDLRRFFSAVHPEDRSGIWRTIREAAEKGGGFEREYRVVRPDGDIRWITLHGSGDIDAKTGVARVRGVSIDVTRRKAAEVEAQKRQAELAHLSRVTMLGELSGSLAHELNQPLTAILSNAQAAQRFLAGGDGNLEEVRAILDDIVREDKRAGEVIRRLRLLLQKGEIRLEALDANQLVDEVLRLLRSDLIGHGVTARTEIGADLPPLLGDRIQIEQVLLNLVTNACDAMASATSAEKRLVVRAQSANGNGVQVSVVDRGCGLPPADLDRIFEPFVTTKKQGMGLGLTVCRTIIAAHGGRLWATNNDDRGASFHFTLPGAEGART